MSAIRIRDVSSSDDSPRVREASFYRRYGKRAVDIIVGGSLLLLAAPVILVLAIAVALTSGWPPFYAAERVGRGGKTFRMWKLRSMVRDADQLLAEWRTQEQGFEDEFQKGFKLQADPRVTPLGRFLRKSSLDELPQLWNVVKGDMSLVGPRPIVEDELRHYGEHAETMLSVRPGITGPWQLNGRNEITYPERVWVELACCNTSTFGGDLALLARTALMPLRFNGR